MRSWRLGTAFGIGIFVHWSFLLLVAFAVIMDRSAGGSGIYGLELLGIAFTCVVLHELGHALMARRFGIATRDITLYPIGGVATLERMSEKPVEELLIALAGPAVNVAILGLLASAFIVYPQAFASFMDLEQRNILVDLARVNLTLVLFNMLPAFPMDGGRVFRALLVPVLGRLAATEVAATVGTMFAILFVILGVFSNPLLLLIAFFGYVAGRQELAAVRYAEYRRRLPPLYALPADGEVLDALPAGSPESIPTSGPSAQRRIWVVQGEGRPLRTYWID
jgi:Zn-dependent protease